LSGIANLHETPQIAQRAAVMADVQRCSFF